MSSEATRGYDRDDTRELFRLLRETGDEQYRERLSELHLPLVRYLAKRFADRGEPLEDLVQVGSVGLMKAIDRFDLEREVKFSTYATPTIVGEIKRYFRDSGWSVRVPRRLQELSLRLGKATARLRQDLGRSPTVAELAAELGVSEDGATLGEMLGDEDARLDQMEYFASIAPAVADLDQREQRIIYLRFFQAMTQSQIAEELGISQMHVSRQLTRTLRFLRARQDDPDATF